jgi:hypothetical protein
MFDKHLNIYALYIYNGNSQKFGEIDFEECNENDKANFERISKKEMGFPKFGISLCPRFNFNQLGHITSLSNFNFKFRIEQCRDFLKCSANPELYKNLYNKGGYYITADLFFVDSQIDLIDDDPYWFSVKKFSTRSYGKPTAIKLEGSVIQTHSLFSFNKFEKRSQFSVLASGPRENFILPSFIFFQITFDSKDMYIYYRNYKTLNSAFANSFALFKLVTWVFAKILSPYYNYYKDTNIINKNFNYEESEQSTNNKVNPSAINVSGDLTVGFVGNRKLEKLTTGTAIKNVSLMRYVLCRRNNRTRLFYNQAKFVISHSLSIENLFSCMVDYFRVKKLLLDNGVINNVNGRGTKLMLDNHLKTEKEYLKLDLLISNSEDAVRTYNNLDNSINK